MHLDRSVSTHEPILIKFDVRDFYEKENSIYVNFYLDRTVSTTSSLTLGRVLFMDVNE